MKILASLIILVGLGGGFWTVKDRFVAGKTDKTLRMALSRQVKSFDPAIVFNDDSLKVVGQSFETLYQYHYLKRPYEVIPLLAEGMPKISNDGKTYTIKIKSGVQYHNNTKIFKEPRFVKAQDFINQIKRLAFKPVKSPGTWLFSGKIKGFNKFAELAGDDFQKMLSTPIEGLKALDDLTLRIDLNHPEPNMLYFLCMTFTTPVPEELLIANNNDLSKTLVGTGAFYLEKEVQNEFFFKKSLDFRPERYPSAGDRYANTQDLLISSSERLPFLNTIIFKSIEDEGERWKAFMDGELDILSVPKKFLVEIVQGDSVIKERLQDQGIKIKHFSSISSRWLGFNMGDPVLGKNKKLRRAIAHAIDFDKYIEVLSNNTNLKANSIFNPSIPGYNPSRKMSYDYDLEKAKSLLEEAGIRPGELELTYSTRGSQTIHMDEANFLKDALSKIGINVKINVLEFSDFIKKGRAGELQFFTDSWIYDYPDAENVLQLLISSNTPGINKSVYKNKKVDSLYKELAKTLEKHQRLSIMRQIEKIVDEEVPWVMLMFESSYILHSSKVKNFRKSFFIRNHLKYIKKE